MALCFYVLEREWVWLGDQRLERRWAVYMIEHRPGWVLGERIVKNIVGWVLHLKLEARKRLVPSTYCHWLTPLEPGSL